MGTAAGADYAAGNTQVVLPGDGDAEARRGDDFEGGEHDCCSEVGVGDGSVGGGVEGLAERGEDVADPDGDTIGGFLVAEEACAMAGGVGEKEV